MRGESAAAPVCLLFATSGHSGVDRVIVNLLAEFAATPFTFDLLTIRNHGPTVTELPANVRHIPLPVKHRNLVVPALIRYLRRERPRALLTANHPLNRAALLARWLSGVTLPIAIRMGMSLSARGAAMGPRPAARLYRSMRRWYPRADRVIAPSPGVAEDLERLAGVRAHRLQVIANPLINPALRAAASERLDHPWLAAGEPPVLVGVGSLEPRKDFATLIAAFAELRRYRPARLVILG